MPRAPGQAILASFPGGSALASKHAICALPGCRLPTAALCSSTRRRASACWYPAWLRCASAAWLMTMIRGCLAHCLWTSCRLPLLPARRRPLPRHHRHPHLPPRRHRHPRPLPRRHRRRHLRRPAHPRRRRRPVRRHHPRTRFRMLDLTSTCQARRWLRSTRPSSRRLRH